MSAAPQLPPSAAPGRPPRRMPLVVAAGLGVVVSVAAITQVARTWVAERRIAARYGAAAAGCYYDGRPQGDCPVPRTGPRADTAWVRAALVDTLYVRAVGHFGPSPTVALAARAVTPGAEAGPWATLAGPSTADAGVLARALTGVAPALAEPDARALADAVLALPRQLPTAADTLGTLWTLEGKQKRYAAEPLARVLAGVPATKQEALQTRGLLAFGPIALTADRAWALAWAARAEPAAESAIPAAVTRSWVLLTRLPDGRWRAVRILPAAA